MHRSSGYGRKLMFRRLWVRIPALYTGWTFFTYICCKNCIVGFKNTKINEKQTAPFLKCFAKRFPYRARSHLSFQPTLTGQLQSRPVKLTVQLFYFCISCTITFGIEINFIISTRVLSLLASGTSTPTRFNSIKQMQQIQGALVVNKQKLQLLLYSFVIQQEQQPK